MSHLNDALGLAERGWAVFQCGEDKRPLNAKGFKGATTKPRVIEILWGSEPKALIGVAMAPQTVALDVDDVTKFKSAGLDLPDGPGQRTRSGGFHRFFRTDGRPVRQTVKEIPGADTRVGGKGYVLAWEPDMFPRPEDLPDAPEWLYASQSESQNGADHAADTDLLIGEDGATHRDQLVTYAGRMRWAGNIEEDIFEALSRAKADGRIIDGDEAWPWSEKDFRQIAKDIGSKPGPEKAPVITINMVPHKKPDRPAPKRQSAASLIKADLTPIEYVIADIMPEGVGIISGAPKIGKSWLAFQSAVEISVAGTMLGYDVLGARPVLYYGLEDGERRFQKRLQMIDGGRGLDLSWLELRYEAANIGEGLEDEIETFINDNEGAVVVIDVLARVWPEQRGRGSAYNQDYRVIGPLKEIQGRHLGSTIVCITHNRKQGADDVISTIQGTHGVAGAVDWTWVIRRERLSTSGNIYVTGRDIEKEPSIDAAFAGLWTPTNSQPHGRSKEQDMLLDALRTQGPMVAQDASDYINEQYPNEKVPWTQNGASEKGNALVLQGLADKDRDRTRPGAPVVFTALSKEEISARREILAAEQNEVLAAQPGRVMPVRRVSRAGTPAGSRAPGGESPSTPSTPSTTPVEPEEGVEPVLAPRRPRAPAYTRGQRETRRLT